MPSLREPMLEPDGETALEQALLAAHPEAKPLRFAMPEPGKHELSGCVAVRLEHPVPHWLVVSRGFTELEEKTEDDPEVSGWGFELTCRLPARSSAPDFGWIVNWMENVSAYLSSQVTMLEPYHHIPMWQATTEDELAAIIFVEEPELAPTRSRNGSFGFLQLVAVTTGEYEALQAWDPAALVALMFERDPLLLVDAHRKSFLKDPEFARAVADGQAREGSSTSFVHGVTIFWASTPGGIEVHLSVEAVALVRWAIAARLDHGKGMLLYGERRKALRPDGSLVVSSQVNVALQPEKGPSEITSSDDGGKLCVLRLNADARAEIAQMPDAPGTYVFRGLKGVKLIVATQERLRSPSYPG